MFKDSPKVYIGDAVYAQCRSGMVLLTVEYGDNQPQAEIFLEPEVWTNLVDWARKKLEVDDGGERTDG